ncbi:hypothetical protein QGM71_19960 [Virgibacillus sp. C22-A2]|uniref:Uncharacterized protein n=1 Tax=Virgibacillus tibetensis TaxID=3042313 RepID=A0ABU6KKT1_9BACI|nr:hypothetical protein [Virgibacillus sp. C22-A2]
MFSFGRRTFVISVIITFIGVMLPWLETIEGNKIGIQTIYGAIIHTLLLISLAFWYFVKNKDLFISILFLLIGALSFYLVLRTYIEFSYVLNPFTRIYWDRGIGVYITGLGSIGIVLAGIIGIKRHITNN